MKRMVLAGLALVLAGRVEAEQYSDDDLCRVIGDTREVALQPRDRLFFEKKCVCFDHVCAASASAAGKTLARKAKQARDQAARAEACEKEVKPLIDISYDGPGPLEEQAAARDEDFKIYMGCFEPNPKPKAIAARLLATQKARRERAEAKELEEQAAKAQAEQEAKERRAATVGACKAVSDAYWDCYLDAKRPDCQKEAADVMEFAQQNGYDFYKCRGDR